MLLLSNVLGKILDVVAEIEDEKQENISDSTEDMVASFIKVNKELRKEENKDKEFVIGSFDVKALYPSLKVEESAKIIRELIEESPVTIETNEVEVSLYLVSNMKEEEIKEAGWSECCHTRVKEGGRRPGMMMDNIVGDTRKGETTWQALCIA